MWRLLVIGGLLTGLGVLIAGCEGTIRRQRDGTWELHFQEADPTVQPACPPEVMGTGQFRGVVYELFDWDCNGVVDRARCPDDRWFELIPIGRPDSGGPDAAAWGPSGEPMGLDYVHAFDEPWNFDFEGLGAAEWIGALGLDVKPRAPVATEVLDLTFDLETWHTDIMVPWASTFALPSFAGHPDKIQGDFLLDESGDGPAFGVIRIAGHVTDVLGYLLAMSTGSIRMEFVDHRDGSLWSVEADAESGLASLAHDGTPVVVISLD